MAATYDKQILTDPIRNNNSFLTISVFVFPPSESCSIRVNFESRYGICFERPSTNAEMTLPKALSDRLIRVASRKRSPSASRIRDYNIIET